MIRKFLIASAVIVCGSFAFNSTAKAGVADVFFGGTVPATCTFTNVVNGTLKLNLAGTTLDSFLSGGTPGSAKLTCNNILGTLTVDSPVQASAPATYDHASAIKTINVVGIGANIVAILAPGIATPVPLPGTTNLTVNMSTTTITPLPSGDYSFYVRLTAAP